MEKVNNEARRCESVVMQFSNGDRETVYGGFLLNIVDEAAARVVCGGISEVQMLQIALNTLEVIGQNNILKYETLEVIAEVMLKDLQKSSETEAGEEL